MTMVRALGARLHIVPSVACYRDLTRKRNYKYAPQEGAVGFHGRLGMRALLALLVSTCLASAQDGGPIVSRHGIGHDTWHVTFYSKLKQDDGSSCCNFDDCRPTLSRSVGDHYEILVDGEWERVPWDTIRKVVAPDRGAHVCAPQGMHDMGWHIIYCVVLPPEG